MTAARGRASTDRWGLPGVFGRWLTLGVVLVILVLGGAVSVLLYHQADQNASAQEKDLTARAARTLVNTTAVLDAGFAGSAAVVDVDGTVDRAGFDAFADAVARATNVRAIGYEPLQWTSPALGSAAAVMGFDAASDATRNAALEAARDSGQTAFSAPIHRQTDGQLAVFVAHALYRPGSSLDTVEDRRANVVGYVTASVPSDAIVDEMISQAGSDVRLQVTDGATALGSTPQMPDGGHRVQVVGGGRTWVVALQRPAPHH